RIGFHEIDILEFLAGVNLEEEFGQNLVLLLDRQLVAREVEGEVLDVFAFLAAFFHGNHRPGTLEFFLILLGIVARGGGGNGKKEDYDPNGALVHELPQTEKVRYASRERYGFRNPVSPRNR